MAEAVYLPKVGMTMEEGTLCRWLVAEGEPVARGQPLFEMETVQGAAGGRGGCPPAPTHHPLTYGAGSAVRG